MKLVLRKSPVALALLALLAACDPGAGTNPPGGWGGGGGNDPAPPPPPPPIAANCGFSPTQGPNGLTVDCTIAGALPDTFIDPGNPNNSDCTPFDLADATMLTLKDQSVTAPATLVYGAQGDDNPARVRVDVQLGASTHNAQIGKTPPRCDDPPFTFPVTTSFAGTHTALVDKTRNPICVFQSRYNPASFSQVIGDGGPDAAFATRSATEDAIERILDLRAAIAVNGLLNSSADLPESFTRRSGRCRNDYEPFDG